MPSDPAVLSVRFPNATVSPIVLTQSMVAASEALAALSCLFNGSGLQPGINFKSVTATGYEIAVSFPDGVESQDVRCLAEDLVKALVGVIAIKKWLKGAVDAVVSEKLPDGMVRIETGRRQGFHDARAAAGFLDAASSEACTRMAAPLLEDGISAMTVAGGGKSVTIRNGEYRAFAASASMPIVSDHTARMYLRVASGTVWSDGALKVFLGGRESVYVEMADQEFKEKLGKNDILVVDLRTIQTMSEGQLYVLHRVVKVLEHR